jgi:hypothetical protein
MIINLWEAVGRGSKYIPFIAITNRGWWVGTRNYDLFKLRLAARQFNNQASIFHLNYEIHYEDNYEIFTEIYYDNNRPKRKIIWINDYSQSAINIEVILNDY